MVTEQGPSLTIICIYQLQQSAAEPSLEVQNKHSGTTQGRGVSHETKETPLIRCVFHLPAGNSLASSMRGKPSPTIVLRYHGANKGTTWNSKTKLATWVLQRVFEGGGFVDNWYWDSLRCWSVSCCYHIVWPYRFAPKPTSLCLGRRTSETCLNSFMYCLSISRLVSLGAPRDSCSSSSLSSLGPWISSIVEFWLCWEGTTSNSVVVRLADILLLHSTQ